MNQYLSIIIAKFMFLTAPVIAQKTNSISMQWEIATQLPADSGRQTALGVAGPVTGIYKGLLFVAGGANFPNAMPWQGGQKKYHAAIHVYNTKQQKLHLLSKSYLLPQPVAYAASCITTKGVLYAGGENQDGISDKVWLMTLDNKAELMLFKKLPSLPFPVTNAAATIIDNKVYLVGGETKVNTTNQFLLLDLNNTATGWKKLADMPQPISHTVMTHCLSKSGNKIYLCGGRKKNSNGISTLYNNVFVYDVILNKWEEKKAMPYTLSAGTGIMFKSNYIVLFGGDDGTTFHRVETMLAAINTEKDEPQKQELILQKNKIQSEHPGFSKNVLLYNIKNDNWEIVDSIPFTTTVTTTAVTNKSCVYIPSGEIKAGVRTPNILSVKINNKGK